MFTRILHPTDFTPVATQALEQAVALARRHDALLRLVHVMQLRAYDAAMLPGARPFLDEARQAVEKELQKRLERLSVPAMNELPELEAVMRRGKAPAEAIVDEARHWGADLIVMGTHGGAQVRKFFIGSIAERVIRYAPCPVMVLGREEDVPGLFQQVLLPVDFSGACSRAARLASSICRDHGARLHAVHVFEDILAPPYVTADAFSWDQEQLDRGRLALKDFCRVHVDSAVDLSLHLLQGRPASSIVETAQKLPADLIVLGTSGLNAVHRFFVGSVTTRVLRRADVPVLTTRER